MKKNSKAEDKRDNVKITSGSYPKRFVATSHSLHAHNVNEIDKLVHEIIKSEGVLFSIEGEVGKKVFVCKNQNIFNGIKRYTKSDIANRIYSIFPIHCLNPYVVLFFRIVRVKFMWDTDFHYKCNDKVMKTAVNTINEFINCIRKIAKSQKFKKTINNYKRRLNKNYESLMEHFDKSFDKKNRYQVIRIDLGYRIDVDNPSLTADEIYEKYCQANEDLKHLLNNKRSKKKIFKEMLVYAWRLEYAQNTGFHYEMFFFFNRSETHEDSNIAETIGEYWNTTITGGRGLYSNCNDKKNKIKYKYIDLGMINDDDSKLSEGLKKIAEYLTKTMDYDVRINEPRIKRTFGKGVGTESVKKSV